VPSLAHLHVCAAERPIATASVAFTALAVVRIAGAYHPVLVVASMALTPLVVLLTPRERWKDVGLCRASPRRVIAGIALTLAVYAGIALACRFAVGRGSDNWIAWLPRPFNGTLPGQRWADGLALVVCLGLVVPLFEEICYRGVLHDLLRSQLSTGATVVTTAAGWAAVHLGNYGLHPMNIRVILSVVPSVFLMGLALGACRLRTNSVVASAAAQGSANLFLAVWALHL
jgi:membrane protease YdiL (CAAX protease family)